MPDDQELRQSRKPPSPPKREKGNHVRSQPDGEGDWWDSPGFKQSQKRRDKSQAKASEESKRSSPKLPLKEVHTIIPLFVGGLAIGLVLGGPVAFVELTKPIRRPEVLMAPLHPIALSGIAYWVSRATKALEALDKLAESRTAMLVLLPFAKFFAVFMFFGSLYAMLSIYVGNFLIGCWGFRGSEATAFGAEHDSKQVTTLCTACGEEVVAPPDRIGFYFECPHCLQLFKVKKQRT